MVLKLKKNYLSVNINNYTMNKKEFPNIAWVVVDSVRSYSGVKDSRDFLDIF